MQYTQYVKWKKKYLFSNPFLVNDLFLHNNKKPKCWRSFRATLILYVGDVLRNMLFNFLFFSTFCSTLMIKVVFFIRYSIKFCIFSVFYSPRRTPPHWKIHKFLKYKVITQLMHRNLPPSPDKLRYHLDHLPTPGKVIFNLRMKRSWITI